MNQHLANQVAHRGKPRPFVWSYSALDVFSQCPLKFHQQYVLGLKEPPSPEQIRGREVHDAIDRKLNGKHYAEELIKPYSLLVNAVYNKFHVAEQGLTEHKMGLTENFEPCEFFARDVWGRCATDVIMINGNKAFVPDWKMGKYSHYKEKFDQHRINACFVFKWFPQVTEVTGVNIYLEAGRIGQKYEFKRENEGGMWSTVIARIQDIEKSMREHKFIKIPGPLCGWCPVTACEHNAR